MKIKVSSLHIISGVVMLFSLDIPFLSTYFGSIVNNLYIFQLFFAFLIVVINYLLKNRGISSSFLFILLFYFEILGTTYFNGADFNSALRLIVTPLLLTLFLDGERNNNNFLDILTSWKIIFIFLLICDLITMVLFPQGLYATRAYTINWFLGYKTQRLIYLLPLCVFEGILKSCRGNSLTFGSYLLMFLSILDAYLSQATGAFVTLGGVCVLIHFTMLFREDSRFFKFLRFFANPYLIIVIYSFITISIVIFTSSTWVQYFVVDILHKSPTLSTRTILWNSSLKIINTSPLIGLGYLNVESFIKIMNSIYYSSPHNMVLSLLITGGVILLLLYVLILISSWNKMRRNNFSRTAFIGIIGIIATLIIGVSSSILVFSYCSFIFFLLVGIDYRRIKGFTLN